MTRCDDFLENPESCPEHANECVECRALAHDLEALDEKLGDLVVEPVRPVSIDALPLAPWEGAKQRPWGLVVAVALSLGGLAALLLMLSGPSAFAAATGSAAAFMPARMVTVGQSVSNFVREASLVTQVGIFISFVIVNAVFFTMLRRSPRGYDAR